MEKKVLPIFMFLLIYAPKVAGSIDSLSAFCFLVLVWSFFRSSYKPKIPNYLIRPVSIYLLFGVVMLAYGVLLFALYGLRDTYQIMRFGRVIINLLGVLGLISVYYSYYKENLGRVLLYHLWLCIIAHAFIILLMFTIPPINEFVITQLVQMDETNRSYETRILGNRIGGLTNSWDATSGIQSLGLLILPFVLHYAGRTPAKRRLILLTIPLSLLAIFLSGVTGLVNVVVIGALFSVFHFSRIKKYIPRFIAVILIIGVIGSVSFNYLAKNHPDLIIDTSIGRTIFMITQNDEFSTHSKRGSTATETIDKIGSEMYFIPMDTQTFLFGKGGSGRSSDYIIEADPGPTLNVHNLGIFFVLILYPYCFFMVLKALKSSKKDLYMGMGISAVLLTVLIIDGKVAYLLARQSLSIMLIGYFSLFWLYRRKENKLRYYSK